MMCDYSLAYSTILSAGQLVPPSYFVWQLTRISLFRSELSSMLLSSSLCTSEVFSCIGEDFLRLAGGDSWARDLVTGAWT